MRVVVTFDEQSGLHIAAVDGRGQPTASLVALAERVIEADLGAVPVPSKFGMRYATKNGGYLEILSDEWFPLEVQGPSQDDVESFSSIFRKLDPPV